MGMAAGSGGPGPHRFVEQIELMLHLGPLKELQIDLGEKPAGLW